MSIFGGRLCGSIFLLAVVGDMEYQWRIGKNLRLIEAGYSRPAREILTHRLFFRRQHD